MLFQRKSLFPKVDLSNYRFNFALITAYDKLENISFGDKVNDLQWISVHEVQLHYQTMGICPNTWNTG